MITVEYKVGDRVRRTDGVDNPGYGIYIGREYIVSKSENGNVFLSGVGSNWISTNFTLIQSNNNPPMASLKDKFALVFKSEPEKSFIQAGVMNNDETLTVEGQQVFMAWLLKENGDKFKTDVVDPILAENKKD